LEKAVAYHRAALAKDESDFRYLDGLYDTYRAMVRLPDLPPGRQMELARDTVELGRKMRAAFPAVYYYRQRLGIDLHLLATLLQRSGAPARDVEPIGREALQLRLGLVEDFSDVPAYRNELATSWALLGHLCRQTQRAAEAEEAYCRACALWEALADRYPGEAEYSHMASATLRVLAVLAAQRRDPAGAERLCRAALDRQEQAMKGAGSRPPRYRAGLRDCHLVLAGALALSGRHIAAVRQLARARTLFPDDPEVDAQAGGILMLCWHHARSDPKLSAEERSRLAESYAFEAVSCLRRATSAGYPIARHLLTDPAYKAFREREDFRKLLDERKTKP
jgi:hypothetical protein